MIDTLVRLLPDARAMLPGLRAAHGLAGHYGLVTLHRPSNADDSAKLGGILTVLQEISCGLPLVFPVHPRTRKQIAELALPDCPTLRLVEPLGYLEFLALQSGARVLITDSGGVQEETTYLGVPCLTLRPNTERPVTVEVGTNVLLGNDLSALRRSVAEILAGRFKRGRIPELWDGQAAERIANLIAAVSS
jgi:UDP-N-acetylglucosamine 2-epimerase (non-hydrolysing)